VATVQRHLGIKYNLTTCTDNHLRSIELHVSEQIEKSQDFLAAVLEELAARQQEALNDSCYSEGA
jgi:hypothetical protein